MTSLNFINFCILELYIQQRISSYFAAKKEVERSAVHHAQTEEASYYHQKHRLSAKNVLTDSSNLDDKVNASIKTNDYMSHYALDVHLKLFPPLLSRKICVLMKTYYFYTDV